MDWQEKLGRDIRRARKAQGMTQQNLADAAGVSENTVGNIERGKHGTLSTYQKLQGVLQGKNAVDYIKVSNGNERRVEGKMLTITTEQDAGGELRVGDTLYLERYRDSEGPDEKVPEGKLVVVEVEGRAVVGRLAVNNNGGYVCMRQGGDVLHITNMDKWWRVVGYRRMLTDDHLTGI